MDDTQTIIALLAGAFPNAKLSRDTVAIYVRALADIPPDELQPIAQAYMLEGSWFPTVRDLRRGVMQARLQLPGPEDAWELALRWANAPPRTRCPADCNRGLVQADAGVQLDRTMIPNDSPHRDWLERIADAAAQPTALCPTCEGTGEIPNPDRPTLAGAVKRALEHVGGRSGITEADSLSVVRAQFLKAYERTSEDALRTANLESAALQLPAGATIAIEP